MRRVPSKSSTASPPRRTSRSAQPSPSMSVTLIFTPSTPASCQSPVASRNASVPALQAVPSVQTAAGKVGTQ